MGVNNYICSDFELLDVWIYNSHQKRCHGLTFFVNCLERQPNMFDSEQDCINMCGKLLYMCAFSDCVTFHSPALCLLFRSVLSFLLSSY